MDRFNVAYPDTISGASIEVLDWDNTDSPEDGEDGDSDDEFHESETEEVLFYKFIFCFHIHEKWLEINRMIVANIF